MVQRGRRVLHSIPIPFPPLSLFTPYPHYPLSHLLFPYFQVNDAEKERMESATEHRRTSALYHEAETRVKALQKELKRAIAKSR